MSKCPSKCSSALTGGTLFKCLSAVSALLKWLSSIQVPKFLQVLNCVSVSRTRLKTVCKTLQKQAPWQAKHIYIYIYIYTNIARNSLLGGVSFSSVVLPIVFSCTGTALCTSMSMDIFWKQLLQKISNILGEYPSEFLKNCGL